MRSKTRAALARIFCATAFACLGIGHARAAVAPRSAQESLVAQAFAYLDGVVDAKGRFVQIDGRGERTSGEIIIHRPGKARFAYDPPSGMLIVSDGRLVSVLNPRLRSFQNYPLGATPLGMLLARTVALGRGAQVTDVARRPHGFAITLRQERRAGTLTLRFADAPTRLLGWTIIDAQGRPTSVTLVDFAPSPPADPRAFEIHDPYLRRAPGEAVR